MSSRSYYRIQPGEENRFAVDFFRDNFIGIDFLETDDLTDAVKGGSVKLVKACVKIFKKRYKKKSDGAINRASKTISEFCLDIKEGDIILCPDDCGNYAIGTVTSGYEYVLGRGKLGLLPPHRRTIKWELDKGIAGRDMSIELRDKLVSRGTVVVVPGDDHGAEIDKILEGKLPQTQIYFGYIAESEKELEDHLFENWNDHGLGSEYDLLGADDELFAGSGLRIKLHKYKLSRQVHTNAGEIDLLAIDKRRGQLLVIELKKKRGSDDAVGQTLRYVGYLKKELKRTGRDMKVKGCIITHGEDHNIICALEALEILKNIQAKGKIVDGIDFYRYEAHQEDMSDFKLVKVDVSKMLKD